MGTIIIGSSANRKGVTVEPNEAFFNGSAVQTIMSGVTEIWSSAKPLVPIMTSNTSPYGEASAQDQYDNNSPAYKAFDGLTTDNSRWTSSAMLNPGTTATRWIQYKFINPTRINKVTFIPRTSNGVYPWQAVKIQGSNDGSSWTDLYSDTTVRNDQREYTLKIPKANYFMYVRMQMTVKNNHTVIASAISVLEMQFYGKQLVGLVPTMTSATTPYGEAISYNMHSSGGTDYPAWRVFDGTTGGVSDYGGFKYPGGIGYKFPKPTCVKGVYINNAYYAGHGSASYAPKDIVVQASNNGTEWNTIYTFENSSKLRYILLSFDNKEKYLYYRCYSNSSSGGGSYCQWVELQFYGDKPLYEPLIPVMTSNTTPSGVASASDNISGFEAYKAFDNDATTRWASNNTKDAYIIYQFESGKTVNSINIKQEYTDSNAPSSGTIYVYGKSGSDSDYIQIGSVPFSVNNFDIMLSLTQKVCKSVKIRVVANDGKYATITSCQLYK